MLVQAVCVNFEKKLVKFKNSEECVSYDKLVLATGTWYVEWITQSLFQHPVVLHIYYS